MNYLPSNMKTFIDIFSSRLPLQIFDVAKWFFLLHLKIPDHKPDCFLFLSRDFAIIFLIISSSCIDIFLICVIVNI